jgi:GT2 family glycosyltransferase
MPSNYTITFACYNQLDYTQQFIASLDRTEVDFSRIVAVDNGSTDGTRDWLQTQGFGQVILNNRNLGCGAAWNQGALAIQSKWTVVMNNDVVCAKGWLKNLLASAEQHELQVASPAMVEGELDYDLEAWAQDASRKMHGYCRKVRHMPCAWPFVKMCGTRLVTLCPCPNCWGMKTVSFFSVRLRSTSKPAPLAMLGCTTSA